MEVLQVVNACLGLLLINYFVIKFEGQFESTRRTLHNCYNSKALLSNVFAMYFI